MQWLNKRLNEPSTFGGLAAMIYGGGELAKSWEAPILADAIGAAAANPSPMGLAMAVLGGLAMIMQEKGRR